MSQAVAFWNGGTAGFAELESGVAATQTVACQGSSLGAWTANPDDVVVCFRDVARRIAVEEIVLREIPDLRVAAVRRGDPPGSFFRRAYAATWRRWFAERVAGQITESDILAYYETHRDRFRQRGSVELSNIFRRHDNPSRPQDTIAELLELKARIEAGASFGQVAREHSQSETRTRQGLVGVVTRGQLPPELEAVVFELDAGEISDPVCVAGGAVIFQARRVTEGSDLPLEMVRERVAGQIAADRRAAAVAQIVKQVQVPEVSVVLSRQALMIALDGSDSDVPVLDVYDTRVTAGELRERERLSAGVRIAKLSAARQESMWNDYVLMRNGALLGAALVDEAEPGLRKVAEAAALEQGGRAIVAETLRREAVPAAVDETALRRHFDEHRDRFRIPLRLKLRICKAPLGDDPAQRSASLDEAHGELAGAAVDLAKICTAAGGRVETLDWATPEQLGARLSSKSLAMVRALDDGAFTVPFQQRGSFVIIELVGRQAAREMNFDEAREQCAREVLAEQGRQAVRRATDARLAGAEFRFDEARVRAILASRSSPPASE